MVGSIFAPPVLTCDEQYDYKGGLVGGVSVGTLPSAKGDEMSRRPARSYACQLTGCDRPLLPGLDRARQSTTRRDDYRHGCSRGSAPTFRAPFVSGSPRPPAALRFRTQSGHGEVPPTRRSRQAWQQLAPTSKSIYRSVRLPGARPFEGAISSVLIARWGERESIM